MTRLTLLLMTAIAGGSIAIACAPSDDEGVDEGTSSIIGGVEARRHEHAALVDIDRGTIGGACSGSVIAPRVVLTAGHCIVGALGFTVSAPYAGAGIRQRVRGRGVVYDYRETANRVNPNQHDVGLILLEAPIRLTTYPRLQRSPLVADTPITKIGRIQNGRLSNTSLFESRPMRVVDGRGYGYPFSYVSSEVIQSGDSGGPDVIAQSDPPIIVAVNSGAGGGTEILARVDLMTAWIDQQVVANGGYAKPGDAGTDASADASPDAAMEAGVDAATDAAIDAGEQDSGSTSPNDDPPRTEDPKPSESEDRSDPAPSGNDEDEDEDEAPKRAKKEPRANSGCTTSNAGALRGSGFFMFALFAAALPAARRRRS